MFAWQVQIRAARASDLMTPLHVGRSANASNAALIQGSYMGKSWLVPSGLTVGYGNHGLFSVNLMIYRFTCEKW